MVTTGDADREMACAATDRGFAVGAPFIRDLLRDLIPVVQDSLPEHCACANPSRSAMPRHLSFAPKAALAENGNPACAVQASKTHRPRKAADR